VKVIIDLSMVSFFDEALRFYYYSLGYIEVSRIPGAISEKAGLGFNDLVQ
jgi:hypothetical protein